MPRQYVAPADFATTVYGAALGAGNLNPGVLDRVLWNASARVDKHCRRKLGIPGTTTLSGSVLAGATTLPLTGTLGIDSDANTVLVVGTGATRETLRIQGLSGIVATLSPYAGTATLYPGVTTAYAHNSGEAVSAFYYEQTNVHGGSTSNTDQAFSFTQQGQIAEMHAPRGTIGENVRVVFLMNFPIIQITGVAVAYPWANVVDQGTPSDLLIVNAEGWYRFSIGAFDPPDSVVHTTYLGGFLTVPDDVWRAVSYEAAAELAMGTNYLGAMSFRRGDYAVTFSHGRGQKGESDSLMSRESSALLCDYKNSVIS